MTNKTRISILSIIFGGALLTALFFALFDQKPQNVLGSVDQGGEYKATTTDATFTLPKSIQIGSGTLGSVVITTAGVGKLTLYDATTTNVGLRAPNKATSTQTLANFVITTTVGTYTFDASFYDGLIAEFTGTNVASTTITYR